VYRNCNSYSNHGSSPKRNSSTALLALLVLEFRFAGDGVTVMLSVSLRCDRVEDDVLPDL
jgi:hypothetical protein